MGELWERSQIWDLVRQYPEYKDGRLTEEQAGEVVERFYGEQEELRAELLKAEISRELMRMAARGEAEYDPERDAWQMKRASGEEG